MSTHSYANLYTDASYRWETKEATIAWTGDLWRGKFQGSMKIKASSIQEAEMAAVKYGLQYIIDNFPHITTVCVNSDNTAVVDTLNPESGIQCSKTNNEMKDIKQIMQGRTLKSRHIKAHTKKNDYCSTMNRLADQLTKLAWKEI